ncbi:hypothetical protein RUND412_000370 [Rhizina undulata]
MDSLQTEPEATNPDWEAIMDEFPLPARRSFLKYGPPENLWHYVTAARNRNRAFSPEVLNRVMEAVRAPPGYVFPDLTVRIPLMTDEPEASNNAAHSKGQETRNAHVNAHNYKSVTAGYTATSSVKDKAVKRPKKQQRPMTVHTPCLNEIPANVNEMDISRPVSHGYQLRRKRGPDAIDSVDPQLNLQPALKKRKIKSPVPESDTTTSSVQPADEAPKHPKIILRFPNYFKQLRMNASRQNSAPDREPTPQPTIIDGNGVKYTRNQTRWIAQNITLLAKNGRNQWSLVASEYAKVFRQERKPLSLMQTWQELVNTPGGPKRFLEDNLLIDNEEVKQVQVPAKVSTAEKKKRSLPEGGKRYIEAEEQWLYEHVQNNYYSKNKKCDWSFTVTEFQKKWGVEKTTTSLSQKFKEVRRKLEEGKLSPAVARNSEGIAEEVEDEKDEEDTVDPNRAGKLLLGSDLF